ncbi:enediyne biosynthesis protein [Kitasatospora sp. NPDC088391]|uniref:enediyne biosynthesis protein n=1 Tax=Kitasatospora sp. NPDC088391 TaxID=3364074 RepID=UPI0037F22CCB
MTATEIAGVAAHAVRPQPGKKQPNRDPRYLALRNFAISMSVFNIFGYTLLGFEQPWLWPLICAPFGYTVEIVLEMISAWAQQRAPRFRGNGVRGLYEFLLPSHITALAANMLLYANDRLLPILLAVFIGVAAKHVLQAPVYGRMRHFMNPSNFGITMALVLFGSWVSIAPPYEFTENANTFFRIGIPLIITTAGTVINAMLTKRVPLIVGWLGGFVIQALLRHWIWDVAIFSALGPMSGVAFVLYTNYMITDPGTTPSKPRNQFMFGSSVAMVYGVLMLFNVVYTLFFATTLVCGLRGAGWWVAHFRAKRKQADGGVQALPGQPAATVTGPHGNEAVAA